MAAAWRLVSEAHAAYVGEVDVTKMKELRDAFVVAVSHFCPEGDKNAIREVFHYFFGSSQDSLLFHSFKKAVGLPLPRKRKSRKTPSGPLARTVPFPKWTKPM